MKQKKSFHRNFKKYKQIFLESFKNFSYLRINQRPADPEDIRDGHEENRLFDDFFQILLAISSHQIRREMRIVAASAHLKI